MKANTVGLVAIVKNETRYILEWIAHYRAIGMGHIIIYDNETDDAEKTLQKLNDAGLVKVIPWSVPEGTSPQLAAYTHALSRFGERFEFMAFFDADEFLVVPPEFNIVDWLSKQPEDVGAIGINQRIFGSSGHVTWDDGLVTERFVRCSRSDYEENHWIKSFYRTSSVEKFVSPHHADLRSGRYILPNGSDAFAALPPENGAALTIDHSLLVLNHYISKSVQEFIGKRARGGGAGPTAFYRKARHANISFMEGREVKGNATSDYTLASRADTLRDIIGHLATAAGLPPHMFPRSIIRRALPDKMLNSGEQILESFLGSERLEGVDKRRLLTTLYMIMDKERGT